MEPSYRPLPDTQASAAIQPTRYLVSFGPSTDEKQIIKNVLDSVRVSVELVDWR